MSKPPLPVVVTVCTDCRQPGTDRADAPGKALHRAIADAADGIEGLRVRPTQCLSVCKRVCTVSIAATGGYTFLFGDLDAVADAPVIVAMAHACRDAPFGFVPWKERPKALRSRIIARIPPPEWSPDDGSAPA